MRRTKNIAIFVTAVILVLACCALAACDPNTPTAKVGNTDVVKAFNAVIPSGNVVTQTAVKSGEKYNVTVITTERAIEYVVGKDFKVENQTNIAGDAQDTAATTAAEQSPLERAYAEALKQSGLTADKVTGFDFDRETYMGKAAYKVEIEEVGAKYEYVFDATDFTLLDSEIEFENDLPTGSYIGEQAAYEFALKAAGVSVSNVYKNVVRSEFDNGRKLYKVSFDFGTYRYDVSIDAVTGDVVKFSKNALATQAPSFSENISAEEAGNIALSFVFPNGEAQEGYTVRKVKLDREDGQFVYEVEINAKGAEYEFEISAKDGAILDVEMDNATSKAQPLPEDRQFITREQAIAAVKQVAGGDIYVLEVEIDKEGGKYYYEIEARVNGVKREYKVDALTGKVSGTSALSAAVLTEEDAVQIAIKAFGLENTAINHKSVKLEHEDGALCYTVKLYVGNTEYEAEIDSATGAVLKKEIDREDDIPPATGAPAVTKEQAIAALKTYLGSQTNAVIGKVELETEYGRQFYEIEVHIGTQEVEYFVDATTGEVGKKADLVSGGKSVISEEQALSLALKAFALEGRENEISLRKIKLEREKGILCYEVEFYIGNLKYEAELNAETGALINKETSYD